MIVLCNHILSVYYYLYLFFRPFDFDAFKRTYSNNDTLTVAIPYFWEKFDKETMSIWHCEYMYPEDLKLIFMTSNLVGGNYNVHYYSVLIILGYLCPPSKNRGYIALRLSVG